MWYICHLQLMIQISEQKKSQYLPDSSAVVTMAKTPADWSSPMGELCRDSRWFQRERTGLELIGSLPHSAEECALMDRDPPSVCFNPLVPSFTCPVCQFCFLSQQIPPPCLYPSFWLESLRTPQVVFIHSCISLMFFFSFFQDILFASASWTSSFFLKTWFFIPCFSVPNT